jgi:glutamyl-tRNA synthetase
MTPPPRPRKARTKPSSAPKTGPPRCRATPTTPTTDAPAWRFATPDVEVAFDDALAGPQRLRPARSVGDFILWTKRGQPSYQLAVVVDDAHSAITDVVRGDDLLDSAARQTLLYHALNLAPTPHYWHLPLVRGHDGRRLAKRHGDTRVDAYRALGVSPERIIGLAASWCGITNHPNTHPNPHPAPQPISARECIPRLDPRTISRSPITFTREDHQWLLTTPTAAS